MLSFTYQTNKKVIYFRHYKVVINEGGLNHSFKELSSQVNKDMSQFRSFADFLNNKKLEEGEQKQTQENQR